MSAHSASIQSPDDSHALWKKRFSNLNVAAAALLATQISCHKYYLLPNSMLTKARA
jgi:hypothetical protein